MVISSDPELRRQAIRDERDQAAQADYGKSVEATGRIDDTNRRNELKVPERPNLHQFAPVRKPGDLRHLVAESTVDPRPSSEKDPWGNDENYVLVTEYLTYQQHEGESPAEHCAKILEDCFGNKFIHYDEQVVERQIRQMQATGWIPGNHISRPGELPVTMLREIGEYWAGLKARTNPPVSDGERLTKIWRKFFGGNEYPLDFPAFLPDGAVIPPRPSVQDGEDLLRSIKYLDAWITHYGSDHWPRGLKEKIWTLYMKKDQQNQRHYANWHIAQVLDEDKAKASEIKRKYWITDDKAIAAFLWVKARERSKPINAKEVTAYYFSSKPAPFAGRYAEGL